MITCLLWIWDKELFTYYNRYIKWNDINKKNKFKRYSNY